VTALVDNRVEQLTEPQREVLRLVAQGLESKQIGRQLDLSHHSIDRRIERAMRSLGASNRYVAARMVVEAEGGTYDPLARAPSHLLSPTESANLSGSDNMADQPAVMQVGGNEPPLSPSLKASFPWPFPTRGGDRLELDLKSRLAWALIGIPILVMIAWGLLLAGIGALDTLKL
jgi:DNA-binding CsgD family transcriptional regulator